MPKKTILITVSTIVALCVLAQIIAMNDTNSDPSADTRLQQFSKEVSKI